VKKNELKTGLEEDIQILAPYLSWAEASRNQDYTSMGKLVLPASDFDEITSNYRKFLESGLDCHYQISDIHVISHAEDGHALVRGSISLVQSTVHIETKGKFTSTCTRKAAEEMDAWLLDGMDIEWY